MCVDVVGMVGIGAMGQPIARHIVEHHSLCVYSRHKDVQNEMKRCGASLACSVADLGKVSSLVFVCVKDYRQCNQVLKELFSSNFHGSIVLLSTVGVEEAQKLNQLSLNAGCSLLALPVSGGVGGADSGDLTGYYAGRSCLRNKALSVAKCFCGKVFDLGEDITTPFAFKSIIQFLVAVNILATSEAASMINRLGLDGETCYQAICSSSGESHIFQNRGRDAINHVFCTGKSGVGIHLKDLRLCSEMLGHAADKYPLLNLCIERFSQSNTVFDSKLDATVITLLNDRTR